MIVNSPLQQEATSPSVTTGPEVERYEAPGIESVITLEEMEREVHYAGITTSGNGAEA